MKLKKTDCILAAYAEPADGPGWANAPIIVIVQDGNGKLRKEFLQPQHQTREMYILYQTSAVVANQMRRLVEDKYREK